MRKSDAIDLKKKAEIAIKEGLKNGKIRKVEPEKVTSFVDDALPLAVEKKDESKQEQPNWISSWMDEAVLASDQSRVIGSFYGADWNRNTYRMILQPPDLLQPALESKINQAHEELATQRKYSRELEKMIVNQNRTIVELIQEKNKIKKQLSDFKEEFNEYVQKYGEATLFIKNEMNRIRRERQKVSEFDEMAS